jgi:rhamnosyl/mannosyltransferase
MKVTTVLYLSPTAQLGGAEHSLMDLADRLDRMRFSPRIMCLGSGPLVATAESRGIPVAVIDVPRTFAQASLRGRRTAAMRMALRVARSLPLIRHIRRAARASHASIIHSNGNKMHLLSVLAGLGPRTGLIWHVRDFWPDGWFERLLVRLANRRTAAVVANSEAVAAHLRRIGVQERLVHAIPNGIDCARFSPDGPVAPLKGQFEWPEDTALVGMVGMFAPWKGQEVFLRAAREVAGRNPRARFLVVGDEIYVTDGHGGYKAHLLGMATALGIADKVSFTGYRDDVPEVLRALDVVVHASVEPEPFGRVIAEAMACARPLVATAGGGVSEVTGAGGEAALLVPPGNPSRLADAVTSLLAEPGYAATLGEAARKRIQSQFTLDRHVRSIESLYDNLHGQARITVVHAGKYYPPIRGGMETVLEHLCADTAALWSVRVIVANDRLKTVAESRNSVEVVRAATVGRFASVSVAPTLPFHLWVRRSDCLVLHEPNPLAGIALFLYTPARCLVIWHHSDLVRPWWAGFVYGRIQRALYRRAHCVVVSSPRLAERSAIVQHARQVEVIPFGIKLDRYAKADARTQARAQNIRARYRDPIILFVGRLVYYKGVDTLLDALTKCQGTLLVAGDGPLQAQLQASAARHGLAGRVHFLGLVDDDHLTDYYRAADIFVLPSRHKTEAFGLAQVEAMACGVPVISTDLPTGVPWVNQHGVTGLVVPAGDANALAAAISRLVADPALREKMGAAGRDRVRVHFCQDRMVSAFTALINRLLG